MLRSLDPLEMSLQTEAEAEELYRKGEIAMAGFSAECPLMMLWLVSCVLLLLFVLVLCAADEADVTLDLVVNVRCNFSLPSS